MLKIFFLSSMIALTLSAQKNCRNNNNNKESCFKGRLEIKALCSNYTIKVLQGNIDTTLVSANWIDENTGKSYTNVFALDSRCSFPKEMQQGEEFYFTIRENKDKNCIVCMAYYPVPPKRLSISVLKTPCP